MGEYQEPESYRPPTLAEAREFVDQAGDGRGLGIDEGVKETVAGLMASGINTRQSCEGHVDQGLTFPWVTVAAPEPEGLADDTSGLLQAQWREANLRERAKLELLLEEFYAGRESDIRIGFDNPDVEGITTLMPVPQPTRNPEMLPRYQQEMSAFTQFLVQRVEAKEARHH